MDWIVYLAPVRSACQKVPSCSIFRCKPESVVSRRLLPLRPANSTTPPFKKRFGFVFFGSGRFGGDQLEWNRTDEFPTCGSPHEWVPSPYLLEELSALAD